MEFNVVITAPQVKRGLARRGKFFAVTGCAAVITQERIGAITTAALPTAEAMVPTIRRRILAAVTTILGRKHSFGGGVLVSGRQSPLP